MSNPKVFRTVGTRALRRIMRYLPLDGGYSLHLFVDGTRFTTPIMNGICNNGPDPALLELYCHLLPKKQGCFLDVGANVGQTLIAVRAASPEMTYVGLEPNVTCVAYVRKLIQCNSIRDATVLPVALMEQVGFLELQLFLENDVDPSASLVIGVRPEKTVARKLHVPCYKWEQISAVLNECPVGFVKIDVEGAELEVLRSIEPLLQSQRPWMLVEILPAYSVDYGDRLQRQTEIEALLARNDLALLRVKKDRFGNLNYLQMIDFIGIHDKIQDCDYFIVPNEDLGAISKYGVRIEKSV